ncbi:DUF1553 domain-containing protein [Candidatus Laterigemmans baculatus]|uniref:DUF1553 domain-containing protein n=1 Tax=Candidatus Laterigemmans baculatus TaxID=2770505 RepID=UPI00193BC007|nr:DUF1553 domain-containing protein [Candidatus Laterigemmans baculatus]
MPPPPLPPFGNPEESSPDSEASFAGEEVLEARLIVAEEHPAPGRRLEPRRRRVRDAFLLLLCLGGLAAMAGGLLVGQPSPAKRYSLAAYRQPSFEDTVAAVDHEFAAAWQEAGITPAAAADPLQIARRLSLGLAGTVPSIEEIRLLERLPEAQQVKWWTEHLLHDRRHADYWAERLARVYVGTENGPFLVYRRRRFVNWLSDAIAQNRNYDAIVRELISDRGVWTDSPAVNFVSVTADPTEGNKPDETRLAGRVSRAFLGVRIDCLQCHDDFLGTLELGSFAGDLGDLQSGEQQHFHQLAAFFSEAQASLLGIHDRPRPYEFQYLDQAAPEVVEPRPPFLPQLLPESGTRRERLSRWVTHPENRPFARATVNRVWALMFGRPLVDPVDSIPLSGEYPPGLEVLAEDFTAHGYDLRRLIRIIASTAVFQRDSRAEYEATPAMEESWALFPLSRLRPEQVAGSLLQACSLQTIDAQSHILFRLARSAQQNEFVTRYGDTGEDEFSEHGGTVTQRLLMMNGKLVDEQIGENPLVNASAHIARYAPDPEQAVETAYLALLARRPTPGEREHFVARITAAPKRNTATVIEDLYWVLINSTEFSWNH